MANKVALCLLIFVCAWEIAHASDFPKGCPTQSLQKTCDYLGAIPSDKVMVFADGTEMPACYLGSASPKLSDADKDRQGELQRIIIKKLQEKYNSQDIITIFGVMSDSSTLLEYMKYDKEGLNAVNELITLQEKVRPPRRGKEKDVKPDVEYAKVEMLKIAEKGKYANAGAKARVLYNISEIENEPMPAARPITCRPNINAFYSPGARKMNQIISVTPVVTHMPEFTKLRIIGHELAHSFDPCQPENNGDHPFQKLVDCLQNDVGTFKKGFFSYDKDPYTCEAFADVFGVYIAEKWQKSQPPAKPIVRDTSPQKIYMPPGYEMIIFDLDHTCRELSERTVSYDHPTSEKRFKDIVLKNPTVAKTLSCPFDAKTPRCEIEEGFKGEKPDFFKGWIEKIKNFR